MGHPTRIVILKALSEGFLSFAELKKKTGIQSSGHLQHHITKLDNLVKTDEYGRYCLTEQGKDALRTVGTVENTTDEKKNHKLRISSKKLAALLLIAIIGSSIGTFWVYDRINTHEKWATEFRVAQQFFIFTDDHEIDNAYRSLHELMRIDQAHTVELGKIDSFLTWYRDPDLNATKRSEADYAFHQIGHKVIDAYGSILNYTSINGISGPSFWYNGPSPPDEATLKEAADIAVNAEAIIHQPTAYNATFG